LMMKRPRLASNMNGDEFFNESDNERVTRTVMIKGTGSSWAWCRQKTLLLLGATVGRGYWF